MAIQITYQLKNAWDEWNLHIAILVSLLFQIVLIFFAASRKRTGHRIIIFFIWGAYLLADWVAAFTVGLIFHGQGNSSNKSHVNDGLASFWAPFLLLHLGGPDTITAFSLEDNELWLRHLVALIFQLATVAYVFLQSIPNDLWIPTVVLFCAGMIKYVERTRALYLACMANLKASMLPQPDAGPDYVQITKGSCNLGIIEEMPYENDASMTLNQEGIHPGNIGDIEMVESGYRFYEIFKRLIVDLIFSFHERKESRRFFFQRHCEDAFNIIGVELNFMYDVFYTKMAVVHCKIGYMFRFTCFALIVLAFYLFASAHQKLQLHRFDLAVTYTLLIGAFSLDFMAIFKLVFSDWTIVLLKNATAKRIVSTIKRKTSYNQRWSNCVSQHSLIRYCLVERFKWFEKAAKSFGLREFIDEIRYKKQVVVKQDLKQFIFSELREKALKAKCSTAAKEIYSARGNWILSQHCPDHRLINESVSERVEYDESLLLWHIATELCYFVEPEGTDQTGQNESGEPSHREFCKLMSEYMLYLLVMRPTMMSAVAGIGQIRFQDTCAEAKRFFNKEKTNPSIFLASSRKFAPERSEQEEERRKACEKLLSVKADVKPVKAKGDRSKSLLFDACILAKDLKDIRTQERWKIMSKLWVELLCYAASHCKANTHVQELSKGGELITFVWLLMAHLGLGDQFKIEVGHSTYLSESWMGFLDGTAYCPQSNAPISLGRIPK